MGRGPLEAFDRGAILAFRLNAGFPKRAKGGFLWVSVAKRSSILPDSVMTQPMAARTSFPRWIGPGGAATIDAGIETFLRSVGSARDVEISAAMAACGSRDAITSAMLRLLEEKRITYTGQDGSLENVRYAIVDPDT